MTAPKAIQPDKRTYNQWVANETLEDFALRYTAKRARKWSDARVANTALGIVSFLALEAIGGAITLQYGFVNSAWAIVTVCLLIFLFGLPICYHAARSGLDIDLLTRGAGFGYIGSTVSSLIYASFTFIFFALEAAIMSMALELLFGIPLQWAYVISALVVIPLVTHGITRISRFQLWTQPIWILLQVAPLVYILFEHGEAVAAWTEYTGIAGGEGFDLMLFGAAAAVIFPLMAQNGEQVDYLRFLPVYPPRPALTPTPLPGGEGLLRWKWWLALTLAGPGWTLFGVIKLFAGSFLAFFALQHGIEAALADDPAHMYLVAFSYVSHNPDLALVLAGVFVIISQLKINVTNAYAGSLAWSNFFSRITHNHPGRIVWLFFNVAIALLLMELGLYQAFETILITYSSLVLAWMGSLVADLAVNRPLGLRPREIEFKRGYLYDINPVGAGSMVIASLAGVSGQLGLFGETAQALAPFVALFLPFVTAPLIARYTGGRYYLARPAEPTDEAEHHCLICDNVFEAEDTCRCTAYQGCICSLCCALDASCGDHCRPGAHLQAQTGALLGRLLPASVIDRLHSSVGRFLWMLTITATLIAGLFGLVQLATESAAPELAAGVGEALFKTYFLLMIVTGVLIWLYVLAGESREKALAEARERSESLGREVAAHDKTYRQLQQTKEAAVAANRAKSRYLSGVSHELRTPLNTILGYAQLLEDDPKLPAGNRRAAVSIRRGGEHLADVIEGLLEISKIEARRVDLHRDQVNLPALLEQLGEMFAAQARARNLAFVYRCDNELPQYVNTDEKRLRQVLINLLSNAVKFTREGEVRLRVSYRNQVARFLVSDTGVGIRPEDQETIFHPFERVRDEATQAVSGTGLGLTISRLLCSLLGGDLALESEYGQGSTFTLSLMLPVVHSPRRQPVARQRIAGYRGPRRRVLVVDDEPGHRALAADYLGPLGFAVREAHNGELALQLVAEQPPDIALLDVHMPLMDGWTLAGRLRETGFDGPIIMVSGNAIEDHRRELASRLHSDYMIKPVRLAELLEKIGAALKLEWSDQPSEAATEASPVQAEQGAPPDPADLEELRRMAVIGYLDGVQRKLDAMEQGGVDPAFIAALREKAEMCDFQALVGLL